jgi:hypothetical protein
MATYFTEFFNVAPEALAKYGAFNVSLVSDLPLFVDPFLLFTSENERYQQLHNEIIRYLVFLRDNAHRARNNNGLLDAWYRFREVRQNWFGYSSTGNAGSGLGRSFARALNDNLQNLFSDFGSELVTKGTHLEKLCLIPKGVGKDNISDFTTNLIKGVLCEYTEAFAKEHLAPEQRRTVLVRKVAFDYQTETWQSRRFELPFLSDDYVLLTPNDILTKDDTWINKSDLIDEFVTLPDALSNGELRAEVNNYFNKVLVRDEKKEPSRQARADAARLTILKYPLLIDYYIRVKEENGDLAQGLSATKVEESAKLFVEHTEHFQRSLATTDFYRTSGNTYEEAHERLAYLKDIIENKGGYRLFYINGQPVQRETDVQIMFRLVWYGTPSDISREVNDGRGCLCPELCVTAIAV